MWAMTVYALHSYAVTWQLLALRVLGGLGRFSQLLEETQHFCCWGQQEVAKIVQCGEALAESREE